MPALKTTRSREMLRLMTEIVAVSILTLYVFVMLRYLDNLYEAHIGGYQSIRSYTLGAVIFFVSAIVFIVLARKFNWRNQAAFYIGSIGVFFPLVLLASIIRISNGLPEPAHTFYINEYCNQHHVQQYCGPALAHIVYSMTVRALPLVLTVPLLLRFLVYDVVPFFVTMIIKEGDDEK